VPLTARTRRRQNIVPRHPDSCCRHFQVFCARPWSTLLLQPRVAGPECACYEVVLGARSVPLEKVWNAPQMVRLREDLLADSPPRVCATCPHAGTGISLYDRLSVFAGSELQKHNIELNRREFLAGSTRLTSRPLCLSLDLSYTCNFHCILCTLRLQEESLSPDEIAEVFDEYSASALHLHVSGGEPLINQDFLRYIEKPTSLPGALSITTNGSRLDASVLEKLERFPRVNLHISVDSFDPLLFRLLRVGGELPAILEAIKLAVSFKQRLNSCSDELRWYVALNFLPTALNVGELPSFLRRAAELGVDGVDICILDGDHPEHDFMRYPRLIYDIDTRALAKAIRRAKEELPSLEVGGLESTICFLEGVMLCKENSA
jgi:hypothetical protein